MIAAGQNTMYMHRQLDHMLVHFILFVMHKELLLCKYKYLCKRTLCRHCYCERVMIIIPNQSQKYSSSPYSRNTLVMQSTVVAQCLWSITLTMFISRTSATMHHWPCCASIAFSSKPVSGDVSGAHDKISATWNGTAEDPNHSIPSAFPVLLHHIPSFTLVNVLWLCNIICPHITAWGFHRKALDCSGTSICFALFCPPANLPNLLMILAFLGAVLELLLQSCYLFQEWNFNRCSLHKKLHGLKYLLLHNSYRCRRFVCDQERSASSGT